MMNAGVDMLMISSHQNIFGSLVERLIKEGKKNVEKGHVLEQRLEEAVTRILAVKLAMGLVTTQNGE
jgi:beta-glucosidase-like glycosyl hydrolase